MRQTKEADSDELEVTQLSDAEVDEELDDTEEFAEVPPPSVATLSKLNVVTNFPTLESIVGKNILFKLDGTGTRREPGWYAGKVHRKVTSRRERLAGYNYNLKFTRRSTKDAPTPFDGTIAVLLNTETYGLNSQWVIFSAK